MRKPGRTILRAMLLPVAMGTLLASMSGCATLFRGDKQKVSMVTDPPGATLVVDGKSYLTPAKVNLKRNQPHVVTITKNGFQGVTFNLRAHWDAGGALAVVSDIIIPGGSALFAVDTLVGADRQFHEMATIRLRPAYGPAGAPVLVYEHHGKLLNKPEYDVEVAQDSKYGNTDENGVLKIPASFKRPTETAQKPADAAHAAPSAPGAPLPTAGASAGPAIPE